MGDTYVGKTSLIMTWTQERFPELHEPTVLDTWFGYHNYREEEVHLTIFDTAGHEDLGNVRPIAYPDTDCFLICYAVDNRESFKNAYTRWIDEVRSYVKEAPCILVGTKSDKRGQASHDGAEEAKFVTPEEAKQAAKDHNFQGAVECSAKNFNDRQLNKVFLMAFRTVFAYRGMKQRDPQSSSVPPRENSFSLASGRHSGPIQRKGCCK